MTADQWYDLLQRMGVRASVAQNWAQPFEEVMGSTVWSDERDLPNFLGQVVHESGMLRHLEENLNYSAVRLSQVWSKRFRKHPEMIAKCASNPRALANFVYGGRMGNTEPDDGWNYRGRGLIQVTGKTNYTLVEEKTGLPVVSNPDLLLEPVPALQASIAWWESEIPDEILDDQDEVSETVNGGDVGKAERARMTEIARQALEDMA